MEIKVNDEWTTETHDFLCDTVRNGANDSKFTVSSLDILRKHETFKKSKKVVVFSDNSGKHFKNRLVMRKMMDIGMLNQQDIWWLFYAPDHGNSLCDAHFGRLSQKRRASPGGANSYATPQRLAELIDTMEKTKAHVINIDRAITLDGKNISGIKQLFAFHFNFPTLSIECFEYWGSEKKKTVQYS